MTLIVQVMVLLVEEMTLISVLEVGTDWDSIGCHSSDLNSNSESVDDIDVGNVDDWVSILSSRLSKVKTIF